MYTEKQNKTPALFQLWALRILLSKRFTLQAFSCYSFIINGKSLQVPNILNKNKLTLKNILQNLGTYYKISEPWEQNYGSINKLPNRRIDCTKKIRNHRLFNSNNASQKTMEQCHENVKGK